MSEMFLQFAILVMLGVLTLLLLSFIRHYLDRQRHSRRRLPVSLIETSTRGDVVSEQITPDTRVCILAFSSVDCVQCRQIQTPVLQRVVELNAESVIAIVHIDIARSPDLVAQYQVLTVPTTVLLDAHGNIHAVNYGFTNAQSLLKQVDEILALDSAQEALF